MGCIRRQAPCFGIELSARTPLHRRVEIRLARRLGFCFGYLLRRNVASRRPFPPPAGPAGGRTTSWRCSCPGRAALVAAQFRSSGFRSTSRMRNAEGAVGLDDLRPSDRSLVARRVRPSRPLRAVDRGGRPSRAAPTSGRNATWLILPVVICLSQRLSHACVSMNKFRL